MLLRIVGGRVGKVGMPQKIFWCNQSIAPVLKAGQSGVLYSNCLFGLSLSFSLIMDSVLFTCLSMYLVLLSFSI